MYLLAICFAFLQVVGLGENKLVQESKSQANYYISNIESGRDIEENLWALTTLSIEKDAVKTFIEGKIEEGEYPNKSLSCFLEIGDDFFSQLKDVVYKTGSSKLWIQLLIASPNKKDLYQEFSSKFNFSKPGSINYKALSQSLIEGKMINDKIISNNSFLLPHFFILFDANAHKLVSKTYLSELIENWKVYTFSNQNLTSTLALVTYFRALYLLDEYPKTASVYNSLISNTVFPNSSIKLKIYRYLDYSMYRLGYFDRNLEIARNFTLPLTKYLNQVSLESRIRYAMAINLYSIGKIKEAEVIYEEILRESNPKVRLSSLYNNLALTKYKLGKYDQYLELQFQALQVAKKTNNYSHQLKIFNNLYLYYQQSNDSERALAYLKNAQQLALKKGHKEDLGKLYILLGSFQSKFRNDFKQATEYFTKADQILSAINNFELYKDLLNEKAQFYEKQENYKKALTVYDEILKATVKNNPSYTDALINKTSIYLKIGYLEKAQDLIEEFKSQELSQLDFQQVIKAETVEADYLYRTEKSDKAIGLLTPALDQIVARVKSSADLKSGFWHVEDEYLDAFELTVSLYIKNGQAGKAVEKLDQLKTINDASLYQNPLVKSSLLNEAELTEFKQLTNQLDVTRKKLLTASEDRQFELRQTISQLKLKKRKLDRKLTEDVDSDPISVREVQNNLSARELVFHITELNDQYYIAQISRSNVTINTIPLDSELRDLLSNSVQQVATHETNLDTLYKISQILELDDIPDHIEQITLIPDSYFYQLPIDILPLQEPTYSYSYGETRYVIENYATQYLTSLNDFQSSSETQPVRDKIDYVGYGVSNFDGYNKQSLVPLPFAQTEVSAIANKLTNLPNIQTFINEQSTKSVFSETAPKASMIHLATHSEVSERDPMFSTIYLSKTNSSADSTFDDQVFAYELFELDLSNEMIMLNSCESGSGPYIQGTGVMGMSRALRYAGANSLVLNLWSVNDKLASDFAIHFYEQLNQGKSKAEALQETKKYFLTHKNASPHFWGPYMLIGNTDPIVEPNQNKNQAMAGIFIVYFLLMAGLSYLTQKEIIFRNRNKNAA